MAGELGVKYQHIEYRMETLKLKRTKEEKRTIKKNESNNAGYFPRRQNKIKQTQYWIEFKSKNETINQWMIEYYEAIGNDASAAYLNTTRSAARSRAYRLGLTEPDELKKYLKLRKAYFENQAIDKTAHDKKLHRLFCLNLNMPYRSNPRGIMWSITKYIQPLIIAGL